MLTITFDPSFDQGFWPGPLAGKSAIAGEIWVGPMGFLNILETMTGLRGPGVPPALRAASLVPALRARSGFWSASAEVDPLGTASKILEWRDYLVMHGWHGQECSPRLRELAMVTQDVLPGIPDRLLDIAQHLSPVGNDISQLTLFHPPDELPLCWQQVLHTLELTGTTVTSKDISPARADGDLAAARRDRFQPNADGSLQLLRPSNPSAAAQEVAAWLSGLDRLDQTVIIGSDSILDQALYRFGLPTTGAGIPVYDNALLQILPLVLEMAWQPPDPQRALELLTLPLSPVPKSIGLRLIRALQKYPAVGSEAWNEALDKGLQTIDDPARKKRLEQRLGALFTSPLTKRSYPAAEVLTRIDLVRSWAKGRMSQEKNELDWHPLLSQLENAQRLIGISGIEHFTAPQIKRMIHDVTQECGESPLFPPQAGLAQVGRPECLVGTAQNIVWWSFHREAAPSVFVDPFTREEKVALAQAGVLLPDPGRQAELNAGRWQRPLLLAENTLLLVCPEHSPAGEERSPHPLWDELVGRMAEDSPASCLEQSHILVPSKPEQQTRTIHPLPRPEPLWRLENPGIIAKSQRESANSLSSLLSCPFQWVVTYPGGLSSGLTASLAEPEELEGWFVHQIVARVLQKCQEDPQKLATAVQEAGRIFDQQGPKLAARFYLPGFDHLRAQVRNTTLTAVEQIIHMLDQAGFEIQDVEEPYSLDISELGCSLVGTPDLVLKSPLAVIDMKRGGMKFRRKEIENGTSVQLAVYGRLLSHGESTTFPPAAYCMLKAGQIISADAASFPQAIALDGLPLEQTWQAVKNGYTQTWEELDQGLIRAPGNDQEPLEESCIMDERLCLAPCAFCDLGLVCGKAFGKH